MPGNVFLKYGRVFRGRLFPDSGAFSVPAKPPRNRKRRISEQLAIFLIFAAGDLIARQDQKRKRYGKAHCHIHCQARLFLINDGMFGQISIIHPAAV